MTVKDGVYHGVCTSKVDHVWTEKQFILHQEFVIKWYVRIYVFQEKSFFSGWFTQKCLTCSSSSRLSNRLELCTAAYVLGDPKRV